MVLKIAFVGAKGVGKTSTILLLVEGKNYYESHGQDLSSSHYITTMAETNDYPARHLYDIDCDENFQSEKKLLKVKFDGYFIMYSVMSLKSFDIAKEFAMSLLERNKRVPLYLVGCMKDDFNRTVGIPAGNQAAKSVGAIFQEITNKDKKDVLRMFEEMLIIINKPEESDCTVL